LTATAATFLLFVIGPAVGLPLKWDQALRLTEIVVPVFLSYMGSMTLFLFRRDQIAQNVPQANSLLPLLVKGPVIVFAVCIVAILVGFALSNRSSASVGTGMSVDQLAAAISAALGILTVTTSSVISYLAD
jgi:hypothetical protein